MAECQEGTEVERRACSRARLYTKLAMRASSMEPTNTPDGGRQRASSNKTSDGRVGNSVAAVLAGLACARARAHRLESTTSRGRPLARHVQRRRPSTSVVTYRTTTSLEKYLGIKRLRPRAEALPPRTRQAAYCSLRPANSEISALPAASSSFRT